MFTTFLFVCALIISPFAHASPDLGDDGTLRAMHAYDLSSYTTSRLGLRARQDCAVPCGGNKCCNDGEVCIPGGCSGCLAGEVRCIPGVEGCCPEGSCSSQVGRCNIPCTTGSSRCGDSCCNPGFACDQSGGFSLCVALSNLLPPPAQTISEPSSPIPSLTPEPPSTTSSDVTTSQILEIIPTPETSMSSATPSSQSTTSIEPSSTTSKAVPSATSTAPQAPATATNILPVFSSASMMDPSDNWALRATVLTALTLFLTVIGWWLV